MPVRAHTMGAFFVTMLITATMILTPPQIRPAAYNQLPPGILNLVENAHRDSEDAKPKNMGQLLRGDTASDGAPDDSLRATFDEHTRLAVSPLVLFVVFHKTLHDSLYRELRIKDAEQDVTNTQGENATTLLMNHGVTFLATNPTLSKVYNKENKLYTNRVVQEWSMPGYDICLKHRMNEYGAMHSIFCSNWTLGNIRCHSGELQLYSHQDTPLSLEVSFVGIFQYDMKIDTRLFRLLRRRIRSYRRERLNRSSEEVQFQFGAGGLVAEQRTALPRSQAFGQFMPNAVKFSPKHKAMLQAQQLRSARTAQRNRLRCCVFYALTHPTPYLLQNPLGRQLLSEFNYFYGTKLIMSDLLPFSILDTFVMPYSDFNHMMPFLNNVMVNLTRSYLFRKSHQKTEVNRECETKNVPQSSYASLNEDSPREPVDPLDVMERALALALAAILDIEFVPMPLKHEKIAA